MFAKQDLLIRESLAKCADQAVKGGEVIGAVATVATLIYLALQIRNNTQEQKRQALIGLVDRLNAREKNVRSEPGLLEILMRGETDFSSLDEFEARLFSTSYSELFGIIESYLEYGRAGDLKPETANALYTRLESDLEHQGVRDWWADLGRHYFAEDFAQLIDRLISEREA